ncbi:MAG TPA: retropepsin-like aspartic protease [Rhodothermales bacterium]|nr:retropepsin-like aspartic protease [Rhodothermales bacterium]
MRRGTAAGTVILISLLASCRYGGPARVEMPADSGAGEISFELLGAGGAAVAVPVYLNGEGPFNFVVDTGATFTCVNDTLARRLNLPERTGRIGFGAGVAGAGRVRLVRIDSLRVGATRAFDLTACTVDLSHVRAGGIHASGLLGLNFLKSFKVTLDFKRKVLTLQRP